MSLILCLNSRVGGAAAAEARLDIKTRPNPAKSKNNRLASSAGWLLIVDS